MRLTPSTENAILIHGAREHNLKNLSLSIPRNQFVVITGVSGSGKSTLAFDLLFARLGTQFCPDCERPVEAQTRDQLGRRLQSELKRRGGLMLLAPVVKNRKGFHSDVAEWAASHGYAELR